MEKQSDILTCEACRIRHATVFRRCLPEALQEITAGKTVVQYAPDEEVFAERMPVTGIYCLHSGRVGLSRRDEHGNSHLLHVVEPGMALGFHDAFHGTTYRYTARALEASEMCSIPLREIRRLVALNPSILVDFMRSICNRIDTMEAVVQAPSDRGNTRHVAGI